MYYTHMYMQDLGGDRSGGRKITGVVTCSEKHALSSEVEGKDLKTGVYPDKHGRAGGAG